MLSRRSLAVLKDGIDRQLFSGAAYALISKRTTGGVGTLGRLAFDRETDRVNRDTLFDVASLTKPLATAMAVLQLLDRGEIKLKNDVGVLLDAPNLAKISVFHLLTHTSGLAAVPLGDEPMMNNPLDAALAAQSATVPGTAYLYSDTGYILLGEIVRRASGKTIDAWFESEIKQPLHLEGSTFRPDVSLPIVATMEDEALDGKPHDPRARALDGVAGHAGLFASINDMAAYSRALLGSGKALLRAPTFARLFTNALDASVGFQSLAFFCTGHLYMPDGNGFNAASVGHSGFTGCFLWIDRTNQAAACLLTNRVLNTEQDPSQFLALRRAWLTAAAEDLELV